MNVDDFLVSLGVECGELLTGRRTKGLFEVAVESTPALSSFVGDSIAVVDSPRLVRRFEPIIDLCNKGSESRGDAVLLVEGKSFLESSVRETVAVCQILGYNTGSRFILLTDVIIVGILVAYHRVGSGGGKVTETGG